MDLYTANDNITVTGIVTEVIFSNEDNGYAVCSIQTDGGKSEITARGIMPFVLPGESVILTGHFENHKVYGLQFAVETYEKHFPDNVTDMETFLASGLIEGVGAATARNIVKAFGEDTVSVLRDNPERLEEVRGITHARAVKIGEAFKEYSQTSEIVILFNKYGLSTGTALKVYRKYGSLSVDAVKKDPYALIDQVPEIGFKTADRIGMAMEFDPVSDNRVCAGIIYVMGMVLSNGHTYYPLDHLVTETAGYIGVPEEAVRNAADILQTREKLSVSEKDGTKIAMLKYIRDAESYTANRLKMMSERTYPVSDEDMDDAISKFEKQTGLVLDDRQRSAVRNSAGSGISIITGGPGTGKTTIIRALVQLLTSRKRKCMLAAPTGRAAKRMTEACGLPAKTIHRLLEYTPAVSDVSLNTDSFGEPKTPEFRKNESNPLDTNVLIIDESSMVDIILLYHLIKAVPPDAQLIFVGDRDQLPSVGPGNVLKDMIRSEAFNTVVLDSIYRQEQGSMIAVNAHRINEGFLPETGKDINDFFILRRYTPEDTLNTLLDVVGTRLPARYGIDPMKDIQVLIPGKKGISGVINVNARLQEMLNPPSRSVKEHNFGDILFREGDRVMQIKNNYDIYWSSTEKTGIEGNGIFNGEMGIIQKVDNAARTVSVLFDDDRLAIYDYPSLNQLEHCYAVTVHKSQGSEFDYCVIALMRGMPLLMTRNILYTAVTRARKMAVLIGDPECIQEMVENNSEQRRYTLLKERITGEIL